jgi:CRP-like cAMP-binding protein
MKQIVDIEKSLESVYEILKHCTQKDKDLISKNCSCVFYPKGKMVFREGEIPAHLICLVSGQVKLFKEGIAGRDWIARMTKSVELIGYRALFGGEAYNVSAETIHDSVICEIDKKTVFDVLKHNSSIAFEIMRLLAKELGFVHAKTITLTQKHIRGRLAETILHLGDTYGYEDDMTLKVSLSREDLASLSNMTTSNAIRTLSAFSAEHLIRLDGRKIRITDMKTLTEISKG